MSAQIGLRLPTRRHRNKRLRGFPEAQEADTGAGAGTGAGAANNTRKSSRARKPNGVIEMQLWSNYSANGA